MDECSQLTDTATAALVEACPVRRLVVARPAWVDPPSPVAVSRDATLAHTGADPPPGCPCADHAARLASLRTNYQSLAARLHRVEDWIDTVSSPLYKRLWFVACGFRWKRLGRWRAPMPMAPWPPRS